MICEVCPRGCKTDRENRQGYCGTGILPRVARAGLHMWEEPCISGSRGSGTVFFSGCNLKCVFCQNYVISRDNYGKEISVEALSRIFLLLQEKGAHNINLVNPTHFTPQIREAIKLASGLAIPVVYNTNAYESIVELEKMKGMVDIYLPDFKYISKAASLRYSGAADYSEKAAEAILEMYRQVGPVRFDSEGLLSQGLVIRHLILPGLTGDSLKILDWIKANLPDDIIVSVMSQYTPYHKASEHPEINRRITRREFERVVNHFSKLDFRHGYYQERDSAAEDYIPDFDLEGV